MAFSHIGYFPFCIKSVEDIDDENNRYNDSYSGFSGYGKIYPTGMTLSDAMALYWKTKYVDWNFFASWSNGSTCSFYFERNGVEPFYPLGYPQDIDDLQKILKLKVCGGDEENPEKYSIRFYGPVRYYVEKTGSDEDCGEGFAGEEEEFVNEDRFVCFFAPRIMFDPDPIEDQEKDFARVVYEESSNLYYPSMLASYYGYSRLFMNQKFLSSSSSYETEDFEPVPLNINGNTYDIPLLQVYNYTTDPPWDGYDTGEINCTLF